MKTVLVKSFSKINTGKTQKRYVHKIALQNENVCWVCNSTNNLEIHHVFGAANRKWSELYGLKLYLCHNHHNENIPGDAGVHFNKELDLRLKRYAQSKFEEVYSHKEFMLIFQKNYL